jgi:predicted glycoside hydrolase/deacetylase ChbG (UPF0249 family)
LGYREAVRLARQHGLPVGVHAIFTAEFDRLEYGPLTPMKTMTTGGRFRPTVEAAWSGADEAEALAELRAQHAALEAEGISPNHVVEHMGVDRGGAFARVLAAFTRETGIPHRGDLASYEAFPMICYRFESRLSVSGHSTDFAKRKARMREKLLGLGPGHHLWVVHPAVDDPRLEEMASPDNPAFNYARIFRVNDYRLLVDADVKAWIAELGIEVVPLAEVPVEKPGG